MPHLFLSIHPFVNGRTFLVHYANAKLSGVALYVCHVPFFYNKKVLENQGLYTFICMVDPIGVEPTTSTMST
jgi:hypothetical protein